MTTSCGNKTCASYLTLAETLEHNLKLTEANQLLRNSHEELLAQYQGMSQQYAERIEILESDEHRAAEAKAVEEMCYNATLGFKSLSVRLEEKQDECQRLRVQAEESHRAMLNLVGQNDEMRETMGMLIDRVSALTVQVEMQRRQAIPVEVHLAHAREVSVGRQHNVQHSEKLFDDETEARHLAIGQTATTSSSSSTRDGNNGSRHDEEFEELRKYYGGGSGGNPWRAPEETGAAAAASATSAYDAALAHTRDSSNTMFQRIAKTNTLESLQPMMEMIHELEKINHSVFRTTATASSLSPPSSSPQRIIPSLPVLRQCISVSGGEQNVPVLQALRECFLEQRYEQMVTPQQPMSADRSRVLQARVAASIADGNQQHDANKEENSDYFHPLPSPQQQQQPYQQHDPPVSSSLVRTLHKIEERNAALKGRIRSLQDSQMADDVVVSSYRQNTDKWRGEAETILLNAALWEEKDQSSKDEHYQQRQEEEERQGTNTTNISYSMSRRVPLDQY